MVERFNVLFVDDEIKILTSIERGIIGEGFKGYFATSGKEALEVLEKVEIAVIVTDMRMPEMDGLQLLKIVKEKYPDIIRIVLSGYSQLPQIIATINKVGVFKFILKPWSLEEDFIPSIKEAINYYMLKRDSDKLKIALEKKNELYQNLLKSSDNLVMDMKKGLNSFVGINAHVLENVKGFLNKKGENIPSELILKYIDIAETFNKSYSEIIFESPTSFNFDKLFKDCEEKIVKAQEISNIRFINNYGKMVRGKYKLALLILNTLLSKSYEVFKEEEFNTNVTVEEKGKIQDSINLLITVEFVFSTKKSLGYFTLLGLFINEILKDMGGKCTFSQGEKGFSVFINQRFGESKL